MVSLSPVLLSLLLYSGWRWKLRQDRVNGGVDRFVWHRMGELRGRRRPGRSADGDDAWVLVHIEVQGQPVRDFARRMFVYYYRIFDRYERPIMSVAILGDEQPNWRPGHFEQELWGCRVELRYPMVKLLDWQERDAELAASANPFAVVVRAYLAALATAGAMDARGRAKLELIRAMYERGYDRVRILELFRLIDWLLTLPAALEAALWREIVRIEEEQRMPYITSVERIGMERGEQIGRREGERAMLRRLIWGRFGRIPEGLDQRLAAADEAELDELADRIAAAGSLDDLA